MVKIKPGIKERFKEKVVFLLTGAAAKPSPTVPTTTGIKIRSYTHHILLKAGTLRFKTMHPAVAGLTNQ